MNDRQSVSALWLGVLAASVGAWFAVSPVLAQSYNPAAARLGSQGASTRIGLIGGSNTRFGVTASVRRSLDEGGTTVGPRFGANRAIGELPSMLLPSESIARIPQIGSNFSRFRLEAPDDAMLQVVSSYAAATDLNNRLGWSPRYAPPSLRTPLHPGGQAENVYQEYFRLYPVDESSTTLVPVVDPNATSDSKEASTDEAPQPLPPAAPRDALSTASLMERMNSIRAQQLMLEAKALFKEVTERNVQNREEKLAELHRLLDAIMQVDQTSEVPALLLVYVALERERELQAAMYLFTALQRNTHLLKDRPDLKQYFGDPSLLAVQASRYILPKEVVKDPSLLAIQAYCAWLQEDMVRAERFAKRGYEISRNRIDEPYLELFNNALRFAMQPE